MSFGIAIESLVSVLLAVTIGYCVMLNGRLKRLKADEQALKATIVELAAATENAERAVAGLKATARDSELTLAERLRSAERLSLDLERQAQLGEGVLQRLTRIVAAARNNGVEPVPPAADPGAMAAAAQAIADRARQRLSGRAA